MIAPVQQGMDGLAQFADLEWLGQQSAMFGAVHFVHDMILVVTGHENDRQLVIEAEHRLGRVRSLHFRHDDIGNEQIDAFDVVAVDVHGLAAVTGLDYLIAKRVEQNAYRAAHIAIVVDQQDGFAMAAHDGLIRFRLLYRFTGVKWQIELEVGAFPRGAVDPDGAAMRLDGAVDHRQAESCAAVNLLGGEEGLENLVELRFRNAAAVITNHQLRHVGFDVEVGEVLQQPLIRAGRVELYDDSGIVVAIDGIAGIVEQVDQNLLQLRLVTVDMQLALGQQDIDVDVLRNHAAGEREGLADEGIQLERLHLHRVLATEGEQLPDHLGSAQTQFVDVLQLLKGRFSLFHIHAGQKNIPLDGGQDIVHVRLHWSIS